MLDAPVEWVSGNPFWSRAYSAYRWVLVGFAATFTVLAVSNALVVVGVLHGSFWPQWNLAPWPWFLFVAPPIYLLPLYLIGHRPGVGTIGIAPLGLLLPSFRRKHLYPWTRMGWLDQTHLNVDTGLGSMRVELTPNQAQRIQRFFEQSSARTLGVDARPLP